MQIDGNFGFVSGIAEMLLQSHEVEHILLALPAAVAEGSVRGLVPWGGGGWGGYYLVWQHIDKGNHST